MKLFSFLVLFLFLQVPTDGVEYGPSISSLTGVFVNWKRPDILALERRVRLGSYEGFSVTLPLISKSSEATSEQIFKERGISTVGEFMVEAPKGFGIIVVIQELKFRKSTRGDRGNPNSTVGCSDYLQFGDTWSDDSSSGKQPSAKVSDQICGTILRDDLKLRPSSLLGPRTFRSPSGQVTVAFNHAYVAELVYSLLGSKQKHILKAELTFTAYKNCSEEETITSLLTEEKTFKVCSDYKKSSDNLTCIKSTLFCDEVYNCGGDNSDSEASLGSDDNSESCPDRPLRTTQTPSIISPDDDNLDPEDKQGGLSDLSTYLGIPSLSSYTTKKYERKFRPSYVSGSSSSSSSSSSSGGGFLYDYRATRRPSDIYSSSSTTQPSLKTSPPPFGVGGSIEIQVIGPAKTAKAQDSSSSVEFDNDIYSRRELSHAINSVIYGVAVFIIFTIFITVFVVCLTKKIQTTWTSRHEERVRRASSIDVENPNTTISRRVSIIPGISHNRSSVGGTTMLTISTGSSSSDIPRPSECGSVRHIDPVQVLDEEDLEINDLPPAYDSLFPTN